MSDSVKLIMAAAAFAMCATTAILAALTPSDGNVAVQRLMKMALIFSASAGAVSALGNAVALMAGP